MWIAVTFAILGASTALVGLLWMRAKHQAKRLSIELAKLEKSSHLLDEQRRVLELIVKADSFKEVLEAVTQAMEGLAQDRYCAVFRVDQEQKCLIEGSSGGLPPEFLKAVNGFTASPQTCAIGSAAFSNQSVVLSDL